MKYKHAFWIGLPFMVLGVGKAMHTFRGHQMGGGPSCHGRKHMFKFLSWRLGLSEEQQSNLHAVFTQVRESMGPLMTKKKKLHEALANAFSKETFDADEALRDFDGKDFETVKSKIAAALTQAHKILSPLQRERLREHFSTRLAHCHGW
jgi:Spy/CpxP family protein refolding chaperone